MKIFLLTACLCLIGCKDHGTLPIGLWDAKPPLAIVANNDKGVILIDGDKQIYCYDSKYYFTEIINASKLKAGDEIK